MSYKPRKESQQLLLLAFNSPSSLAKLSLQEWELLIRMVRANKLLASLAAKIALTCPNMTIPAKVAENFQAAQQLVDYRKKLVIWELNRLNRVLVDLNIDIVVLKGGAYIIQGLQMATGRLLSDIDLLVPKQDIERVEKHLLAHGWQTTQFDEYDQQYYRTWMHEIPALQHRDRFIEVDIHHTILPLTSRLHPDPRQLLADAVTVDNICKILSPYDMVLHSAVHLFYDAELNASDFRDLLDLHELLSLFSRQELNFWERLDKRAMELELQRPLYYALYFSKQLFDTKVPADILFENKGQPPNGVRILMEYCVPLALLPEHPDYPAKKVAFIRWVFYIRSHYLRMPLALLIPHLWKKSKKRLQPVTK
ncbi:MAG: hypothetical protein GQ581_00800 [Methyloprofundus sp.]|nr:hypothetical protein [Methyloprofundus sp.]